MPERSKKLPVDDRVMTFRIPADLLEGLQQLWERDGISQSESIRRALRAWLDTKGIAKPQARARTKAHRKK
jgi:Arc/MetJ-type ribon-helix-helix transcriptional regulator